MNWTSSSGMADGADMGGYLTGFYFDPGDYPEGLADFVERFGIEGWVWIRFSVVEPEGGADYWDNPALVDCVALGDASGSGHARDDGYFYFDDYPDEQRALREALNEDMARKMSIMAMAEGSVFRYKAASVE